MSEPGQLHAGERIPGFEGTQKFLGEWSGTLVRQRIKEFFNVYTHVILHVHVYARQKIWLQSLKLSSFKLLLNTAFLFPK